MLELWLALAAVAMVGLFGVVAALTPSIVTAVGLTTLLLGLALALPTGLWYHVVLYRFVSARTTLPRAWWVSPSGLHRHLTPAEQRHIAPWYRLGGVGFILSLSGGLAAIAGLLLGR
jgi:hypothetical protein